MCEIFCAFAKVYLLLDSIKGGIVRYNTSPLNIRARLQYFKVVRVSKKLAEQAEIYSQNISWFVLFCVLLWSIQKGEYISVRERYNRRCDKNCKAWPVEMKERSTHHYSLTFQSNNALRSLSSEVRYRTSKLLSDHWMNCCGNYY